MLTFLGLVGCLISFLPAIFDNGKRKKAFLEAEKTVEKVTTGIEWILVNWMLPILTLAVFIGDKIESDSTQKQHDSALLAQSNRLARAESNNIVLKTNISALELKVLPRSVTGEQIKDFIFLTEKVPKIPIKICIGQDGGDVWSFALQLRHMFNEAGFLVDPSAKVAGITTNDREILFRPFGEIYEWPSVFFVEYGTSNQTGRASFPAPPVENIKGFERPIMTPKDKGMMLGALINIFQQIGLTPVIYKSTTLVSPGEIAILVPQQNN